MLKRLDPTHRLDQLPKLKSNSFLVDGKIAYTGSRIKRGVKVTMGIYRHHGFIYGYGEDDVLWIIENNTNGVECVSLRDFANGIGYVIEINNDPFRVADIMKRAKERALVPYHGRDNNCETFVNYCLLGLLVSQQTKNTEDIVNAVLTSLEAQWVGDTNKKKTLELSGKLRDTFKLKRPEKTEAMVKKYFEKVKNEMPVNGKKGGRIDGEDETERHPG